MSGYICKSCRLSMRLSLRPQRLPYLSQIRKYKDDTFFDSDNMRPMGLDPNHKPEEPTPIKDLKDFQAEAETSQNQPQSQPTVRRTIWQSNQPYINIDSLLSKPTWSVNSLLPSGGIPPEDEITTEKLHHLLRLSALPLPKNEQHEARMLETLHSHLHFVRDIQKVKTEGVEPLRSIRDETEEGMKDITIGMEQLKEAFAKEDIVGKNKRPRRRRGGIVDTKGVEDWDVLGSASETVQVGSARYFVVRKNNGQVRTPGRFGGSMGAKREKPGKPWKEYKAPVDKMYKKSD